MMDNFKIQTRDMLVSCLENAEYIDIALLTYADQLLDIDDENAKEAENLAMLISQYANYLDPRHCDPERVRDTAEQTQLLVLKDIKDDCACMLEEVYPISFDPFMRIKTLKSYFRKIWGSNSTPSIAIAEDKVRDLLALRFILNGTTAEEYVLDCYRVHDSLIEYIENSYNFKQVLTTTKDTEGFDITKFSPEDIYVPPKELIPECNHLAKAKDYIYTPKWNGYQGIQSSLYSPSLNVFLEVQVKTLIMHHNAEYFESSHDEVFKPNTAAENFDYRRFNKLHGFHSRDGKKYTDRIGLFNPRRNF